MPDITGTDAELILRLGMCPGPDDHEFACPHCEEPIDLSVPWPEPPNIEDLTCTFCEAPAGQPCRSAGGTVTKPHQPRATAHRAAIADQYPIHCETRDCPGSKAHGGLDVAELECNECGATTFDSTQQEEAGGYEAYVRQLTDPSRRTMSLTLEVEASIDDTDETVLEAMRDFLGLSARAREGQVEPIAYVKFLQVTKQTTEQA